MPPGAILLTTRATIGDSSIALSECTTNQGFQSIIAKEYVSNEFLYYLLQTRKSELITKANGSTFIEISNSEIKNLIISVPSKNEQIKIASFLSLIDKRIDTQNKIIKELESFKKQINYRFFNEIKEFTKLGELCDITTGKLDANQSNEDGIYPFFTCGRETLKIDNYAFDCEAILIAGNGDMGTSKYYKGKFNAYQRTYVLYNFKDESLFVKNAIDYYLPMKIASESQSSAMSYIKMDTLKTLNIPIVSTHEKEMIIHINNNIYEKIINEKDILSRFIMQKEYLLKNLFI